MSGSYFTLNQKYNALLALFNQFFPYPPSPTPYPPPTDVMTLSTAQTATGLKTFSTLPQSSVTPTIGDQLVNKTYADSLIPTPVNAVTIDGTQTLLTGIKTFTNLPECSAVPISGSQLVNKTYVDGAIPATPDLQAVLTAGNSATGANAKISLTDSGTGGLANPTLTLTNSNATINTIPTIEFNKTGRNLTAGESVGSISMYGLDATAQKTEFSRIQTKTENVTGGNEDGTLSIFNSVNGVISETFNFNGGQNENNSFRPLDMNTNAIREISTATAKTSLVVDNAVVGANATLTQSNLTINATGLSATPVLNLNQSGVGSGILYEEMYNQRTAQTGEFNRMSFYAKNSAGTKTEYGRIHQNAVAFTAGAVKGRMDFAVGNGSGLQDYLSLNANTGQVDILNSDLDLNANDIVSVSSITTPLNNQYSKEQVVYLTTNTTAPVASVESNLRYTAFSLGKTAEWLQATSVTTNGFVSGVENITASYPTWDGNFWVGTDVGNIYYSSDGGANWTLQGSYGGRIRVFCPYNGNTLMAVGGDFSSVSYNYLVGINNTTYSSFDITGSSTGMNNSVYTIYDNPANSCLYIGGAFDDYYGVLSASYPKWITLDYNTNTFYTFSNASNNGFFGGDVLSITKDTANSNFIVVGGSFTNLQVSGSPVTIPYIFTFITGTGYDVTGYFSIGTILNAPVSSVLGYSGGVYIGGSFTNPAISPTWTDNYGMSIFWSGSSWDLSNYLIGSPSPITSITYIPTTGVYYTIVNTNRIYANTTLYTPDLPPFGSVWECVAYNGSQTLFATNAQTTAGFLFYYYDQNVGITINGGGNVFRNQSSSVSTNCLLTNINSAVEMIWNSTLGAWFVISQEGCSFS
jgi:hypothetical protein